LAQGVMSRVVASLRSARGFPAMLKKFCQRGSQVFPAEALRGACQRRHPRRFATHYADVASDAYERAFFYSAPEYMQWYLKHCLAHLSLSGGAVEVPLRVVDIGGGTGNFTLSLKEAANLQGDILCVDSSQEMLNLAAPREGVATLLDDAVSFSQRAERYDRALLKEVVHHVPKSDIPKMYKGFFSQLRPGGVVLTVTRPQEVDYPLFAAAHDVWKHNQPPHTVVIDAMSAVGFEVVVEEHTYVASLPKERWFAMVRSRFWSTFSFFSDEELEQGVAELEEKYTCASEVTFNDRLFFLVGRKPWSSGEGHA